MPAVSLRATLIAFSIGAIAVSTLAYATTAMKPSTEQDLKQAMHGEAFATLKYMAYADAARAHGNTDLADLFDTIAVVEHREHFAEHAKLIGLVKSDMENLKDAMTGESYETSSMYPQMASRADAAGDKAAARLFREVSADEAKHRDAYQEALARLAR